MKENLASTRSRTNCDRNRYSHDPDLIRRHTLAEQKTAAISSQESSRVKGTIKAHNSTITQMTTMSGDYLLLTVSDDRNVNVRHVSDLYVLDLE